MDRQTPEEQQLEGSFDKGKGRVKEALGALTGDSSLKTEGKMDQAEGTLEKGVGKVREAIKKNI